jgi:hypothetical protein
MLCSGRLIGCEKMVMLNCILFTRGKNELDRPVRNCARDKITENLILGFMSSGKLRCMICSY